MSTRKPPRKGQAQGTSTAGDQTKRPERFRQISTGSSQIVKDAAALLDDEIASGVVAAKQVQQRFQKERRIDPADFKDTLTRVQSDGHEVVNLLGDQFAQLRSQESGDLVKRFTGNAHSMLDLFVELINTGSELADQLVQTNLPKKTDRGDGKSGR